MISPELQELVAYVSQLTQPAVITLDALAEEDRDG